MITEEYSTKEQIRKHRLEQQENSRKRLAALTPEERVKYEKEIIEWRKRADAILEGLNVYTAKIDTD